jgi:hypothetical protein
MIDLIADCNVTALQWTTQMIPQDNLKVAEKAKRIYSRQLRTDLEANHLNRFVAIEPESGDYFIADSFSQAVADARNMYPSRISFVIRVGHDAALHMGGISN